MKLETATELTRVADEFGVELPATNKYFQRLKKTTTFIRVDGHPDGIEKENYEIIKRYTTDELLEWLPAIIYYGNETLFLTLGKLANKYVAYYRSGSEISIYVNGDDTPSEALSLLAIELITNKVIK